MCGREAFIRVVGLFADHKFEGLESSERATVAAGGEEKEFPPLVIGEVVNNFPEPFDLLVVFGVVLVDDALLQRLEVELDHSADELHDLVNFEELRGERSGLRGGSRRR